ncbi:hypothetical protein C4544_00060, partial [candidate division WS5 bacterium]
MKNRDKNNTKKVLYRRTSTLSIVLIFIFFLIIILPQRVWGFDNSRVIDDSKFSNKGTMNESQIQSFLSSRGSYLASYTVPAERDIAWQGVVYHESPWLGPVGSEVNTTGWSAAKVIYNVSQWYGINPQVLLATLQKESSLVTNPSPPYYGLVQWAMGYAYTEGGIINACGTATNHNPTGSCAGFAMQMDWAGGGLKSWMNWANSHDSRAGQYYTGNTISIDGQAIYLGNGATAALYRYTPHIQTSFYNIFTLWFGSTIWNGPYVIANASSPEPRDYYLVDNGKKRYLSYATYVNWGLGKYPVDLVSSGTFNNYPTDTALNRFVRDESGNIFIIDKGERKWVPSWPAFDLWGFNRADILTISSITLNYLPRGINFSYIVKEPDPSPNIYLIDSGTKRHILNGDLLGHLGVPTINIGVVSAELLNTLSSGNDFTSFLIKGSGADEFALSKGKKRYISNRDLFDDWNFNLSDINIVNDSTLSLLSSGSNLSYLMQRPNGNAVYFIENKGKKTIREWDTFNHWRFLETNIFTLHSSANFNALSNKSDLTRLPSSSVDGKIYLVDGGKKRAVQSPLAFNLFGLNWNKVSESLPETMAILPDGNSINVPTGCSASCVNVYRFYDHKLGTHFYTAATIEKNNLLKSPTIYRYEGISNSGESSQQPGTIAVHRFYNYKNGTHFYTANQAEATYVN